jgi:hypothetical protein
MHAMRTSHRITNIFRKPFFFQTLHNSLSFVFDYLKLKSNVDKQIVPQVPQCTFIDLSAITQHTVNILK